MIFIFIAFIENVKCFTSCWLFLWENKFDWEKTFIYDIYVFIDSDAPENYFCICNHSVVILHIHFCFIVKSNNPALSLLSVYSKPEFEG